MNVRNAHWRFLAILGAMAAVTPAVSCGHRNDDINRVQPGFVRKAIFQSEDEWYYRRTIAKSETTNAYIVEGQGDIFLDRVKWRIEEGVLLAYKPYESAPGSNFAELEGYKDFEGTILAAWPITSHFDIQRGYDPLTGNESNILNENATDRHWHEREYMRVDWASNLIEGSLWADRSGVWFPITYVSTGSQWTNLETRPTDPYASRFSDDYVEVTDSALLGMDIYTCAAFVGYSWAGIDLCGYGEAKVRHSFVRIKEKSDFIPRDFPDSVVRTGTDGKPIYDDETGEVVREPIFDRFGFFRTEIPTYDRGYGRTESGRLYRATLFNLWERHTDENGNVIPMADRTPKPIVYYLNAEFPARYRLLAQEIAAEYKRVFSGMVGDVKSAAVPDMFVIKDNDCNEGNIISTVSNNPDLLYAVERAVCNNGEPCNVTEANLEEKIGIGNLKTVCSSLEAATLDPTTGVSEFTWQRIGDNRYNMVVWLPNPQASGWGGYGPMFADGRTGEITSSSAFIRGHYYEITAATIVDYIEFINDEKSIEEIIYGQDIRRHMTETLQRKNAMSNAKASSAYMSRLNQRMGRMGSSKEELLSEIPNPRHQLIRMEKLRNTRAEEKLITQYDLAMASEGRWSPGMEMDDELIERASPIGRLMDQNPLSPVYQHARAALGAAGFCFLQHEFDPHWAGLALKLKNLGREDRYKVVRDRLVKHVILHELGHNVGLRHNFEGTYDAMNYDDKFWDLHWQTEEEKIAGQYDEFRNTSVMEYIASGKGMFTDYLGKYDEAALRFGYVNHVSVFTGQSVDQALEGGEDLRRWRYLNDYTKIPNHLCGATGCSDPIAAREAIRERDWVDFDPQNPPANEVPFLFCSDEFSRQTPFCATFDYGSNLREIHTNYYSWWSDYFFFNNFIRDRLTPMSWSPSRAMYPVLYSMFNLDLVAQYYYYLNVADSEFAQTDLAQDMATTMAHGLNMAAEIIATPEPIRMCPWPGSQNPQIFIPWYFLNDCDEYADLNSDYAIRAEAIQPPLGDARPSTIGFTQDYEDWDWRFVGSYFDKSNVLMYLGYSWPRLFRFNYDLDVRNYFISLYRLFEPELREFYYNLIQLDSAFLRSSTAETLGSYWCRDETAPTVAHLGHFEPRKMIDPVNNISMPGPSADCEEPAVVYPELISGMPFQAMAWAHVMFSSDFDAQLDMGKQLKVYVVGADDEFVDWGVYQDCEVAAAGAPCYCSMVDGLTGLEYRALETNNGLPGLGCLMIAYTVDAQASYESNGNPYYQDNWRQWVERLEYARDLYRTFHAH